MKRKDILMYRAVKVSLFGNVLLFGLKLTAFLIVNSLAIATDLAITVIGLVVSLILFYTIKLANQPADLLHNYGYGKMEHVCEIIEGIVLIGMALAMSVQAILHFSHPSEVHMPLVGFAFSLIGCTINFIGAAWILKLARASDSPAVKAEGLHYKLEGYISFTVAMALLATSIISRTVLKDWAVYLDPAATLIVSILIAYPSVKLVQHAFIKLLDVSIEEKSKIEVIAQLAKYINQCCEFRDIRSRGAGRNNFVELKAVMPEILSFTNAHKIANAMEADLRRRIPRCQVTVKIVPCEGQCAANESSNPCPYHAAAKEMNLKEAAEANI